MWAPPPLASHQVVIDGVWVRVPPTSLMVVAVPHVIKW